MFTGNPNDQYITYDGEDEAYSMMVVTSCCPGCRCSRSGDELGARQCLNNELSEHTGSIGWKRALSECP
jgi:hypothetical protein